MIALGAKCYDRPGTQKCELVGAWPQAHENL